MFFFFFVISSVSLKSYELFILFFFARTWFADVNLETHLSSAGSICQMFTLFCDERGGTQFVCIDPMCLIIWTGNSSDNRRLHIRDDARFLFITDNLNPNDNADEYSLCVCVCVPPSFALYIWALEKCLASENTNGMKKNQKKKSKEEKRRFFFSSKKNIKRNDDRIEVIV